MSRISVILLVMMTFLMQGCIHEYPVATPGGPHPPGEDPTLVETYVNVNFDINWQELLHKIDFGNTTRSLGPHHFVIEIQDEDGVEYHEDLDVSEDDFSTGNLHHRVTTLLSKKNYAVAAWYDRTNDSGDYSYTSESLDGISLVNFSTMESEALTCAHASTVLNLSDYDVSQGTVDVELELSHPGARFEIVATDINYFIESRRDALLQGDKFTIEVRFHSGAGTKFNVYSGMVDYRNESPVFSGRLRLPFDEYEELKVAEGYIFCEEESEARLSVAVINSALMPVSETAEFTIPVKRGYITVVSGDFLTSIVNGIFTVDTIWEGEIEFEI